MRSRSTRTLMAMSQSFAVMALIVSLRFQSEYSILSAIFLQALIWLPTFLD